MSGKNRLYPHLLPHDIVVWERFLAQHESDYLSFDYDVRVGRGRDPGESYQPNIRQMGVDLSQRRIDAVGFKPDYIDIIEVTTHAGIHAIGQLQTYPFLYTLTYKPLKPLRSLLVCSELGSDVLPALQFHHILYYIYPD